MGLMEADARPPFFVPLSREDGEKRNYHSNFSACLLHLLRHNTVSACLFDQGENYAKHPPLAQGRSNHSLPPPPRFRLLEVGRGAFSGKVIQAIGLRSSLQKNSSSAPYL